MATRIATTSTQDLQGLGMAGQLAIESWSALAALLARELSPAHAALLAEPVVNPSRGEVDWYSAGEVLPFADLEQERREAAQACLDRLVSDVATLSDRLRISSKDSDRFLADMLALAMQVPGPDFVRLQGDQPVLVAWGHARTGPAAEHVTLTARLHVPATARAHAAPIAAMVILPPPRSPFRVALCRRRWLWPAFGASAVAAVLILGMFWWDPFGWLKVPLAQCRAATRRVDLTETLRDEAAREGALRMELAALATDAGQRRLMCPSPPASSDARRVERQGGQLGKLQVILAWDDPNDLDLHVICPGGTEINFRTRSACGGTLDVDANGNGRQLTITPVENVYFNDPLPGHYRVVVDPYEMRASPTTAFRVTIRRDGRSDQVITGMATSENRSQPVAEFEVTPP